MADQAAAGQSIWSVLTVPETAGTAADSVDVPSKVYSEHTDPMSGSIYKFNNHTGSSHWLHALLPPVTASLRNDLKNDEAPMSPRLAGTGVGALLSTLADESAQAAAGEGGLPPPLFLAPTVSEEVEAPMTPSRASTSSHPTTLSHSHSLPTPTTSRTRAATVRRGSVSEMVNPLLSAKKSSLRRLNKKYTSSRGEKVSVTEKEDGVVNRLGSDMIEKQPQNAMRPRKSSINLLGTSGKDADMVSNMDERRAAAEARAAAVGRGSTIDGEGVDALRETIVKGGGESKEESRSRGASRTLVHSQSAPMESERGSSIRLSKEFASDMVKDEAKRTKMQKVGAAEEMKRQFNTCKCVCHMAHSFRERPPPAHRLRMPLITHWIIAPPLSPCF